MLRTTRRTEGNAAVRNIKYTEGNNTRGGKGGRQTERGGGRVGGGEVVRDGSATFRVLHASHLILSGKGGGQSKCRRVLSNGEGREGGVDTAVIDSQTSGRGGWNRSRY